VGEPSDNGWRLVPCRRLTAAPKEASQRKFFHKSTGDSSCPLDTHNAADQWPNNVPFFFFFFFFGLGQAKCWARKMAKSAGGDSLRELSEEIDISPFRRSKLVARNRRTPVWGEGKMCQHEVKQLTLILLPPSGNRKAEEQKNSLQIWTRPNLANNFTAQKRRLRSPNYANFPPTFGFSHLSAGKAAKRPRSLGKILAKFAYYLERRVWKAK